MRVFLDTSALAKRYVQESGSEELEEFFASIQAEVYVSTLAFIEFSSALGRKLHNKEISKLNGSDAFKELEKDWHEVFVKIPLENTLAESAAVIALEYLLKGSDAVHLASAQVIEAELFVASDNKLTRVAKKMGMGTYNPEYGSYE